VTSDLLGRSRDNPLPFHTSEVSLANDFLQFFTDKMVQLRNDLDNVPQGPSEMSLSSNSTCVTFIEFQSLTESEVRKLVFASKSSTCDLDVIPTMKLKEFFTQFAPVVTEIVNQSLQSGVFSNGRRQSSNLS